MEWIIGAFGTLSGFVISYLSFQRNRDREIKSRAAGSATESAVVRTKLDAIGQGVDSIRIDLKANEKQMVHLGERVTRVEESTKQAHKRIDNIREDA